MIPVTTTGITPGAMRNPDDNGNGPVGDWTWSSWGVSIVVGAIVGAIVGGIIGAIIGGLFLGSVPLLVWRLLRGPP